MTSSISDSPNHCNHNNITPLKSFDHQGSYDIVTDTASNKLTVAVQPSIPLIVATTISSNRIERQKYLTKSGELKPKSSEKSRMVSQPNPIAGSGMVWRLTEEDCLEALPTILVTTTAATNATRKMKRRKTSKSNANKYKAAQPIEQFQQSIPRPYTTPTENVTAATAGDSYKPSEVECLPALSLRSVLGAVEAQPIVVPVGVKIPIGIEIHRRLSWLPVGWTMWRLIRITGESINRVDTLYYTANGKKCRSMRDVFYVLTKGRLPNVNDSLHVDQEFEYEVPKEMVSWYGQGAGVTVHLTSINIRVLPGGTLSINPINSPPIPPISVKKVKVPAGTPYKEIGTLVRPVRLLRKKYKLLRLLSRESKFSHLDFS